jgi:hypothetical protein
MIARFVTLAAVVLCLGTASFATADPQTPAPSPTPVNLPTLPPNSPLNPLVKFGIDLVTGLVKAQLSNNPNAANGEVSYFKRFEMQVRTGPNSYRSVHLHQGTVIDPRGESIQPGQRVDVGGAGQPDGSLNANLITIQQ